MCVHYKGIAKAENRPIVTRDSLMPTCLIPIYANKAKHSRWENGGTLEERKGKGCIGDKECAEKRETENECVSLTLCIVNCPT